MKKVKPQLLYALVGASGGLAGMLPLSRCSGNCAACFGCAGVGQQSGRMGDGVFPATR